MAKNGGRNKRSKAKESKYKADDQVNRTVGEDDPWDPVEAIESTVSNLERNVPSRKKDRFQTFFRISKIFSVTKNKLYIKISATHVFLRYFVNR